LEEIAGVKPYRKNLATLDYKVLPKVYGGGTDTELLCECLRFRKGQDVWDVGTGTGAVALYAKKKGAGYVLATDISANALKNARLNVKASGMAIKIRKADVFCGISRRFDVITFNPPYTDSKAEEDYQVCFWDKGNLATKKFFAGLKKHLKENGKAFVCWSSFADQQLIPGLSKKHGFNFEIVGKRKGKSGFVYFTYQITMREKNSDSS
jgi:release factor glutamine methyltransferase